MGEKAHFLRGWVSFLVLEQQRKRNDETTDASKSTPAQETLAGMWGGSKCLNISSSLNSLSVLPNWHWGKPLLWQQLQRCAGGSASSVPCSQCHSLGVLAPSASAAPELGVQSSSCLLPKCFWPCCAPLPMIPQPVGEVGGFKLWFTCVSLALFPNLNYSACSRRNSVMLAERLYQPPEYHVCYQRQTRVQ